MLFLLTRGRGPFLGFLLAITLVLGWQAAHLDVEKNNESLTTNDPEQARIYEQFKQTFGDDEDLLLAVAHPSLLQPTGIQFLTTLTAEIQQIAGVRHVFSLTNARQLISSDEGFEDVPLLPADLTSPNAEANVRAALDRNPDFTGTLISTDRRTAGIVIELEDRAHDFEYRGAVIGALRRLITNRSADKISLHLTGIAVQKNDVSEFIERDRNLLMPTAVVILGATLLAFFRRALGVLLPLAVTGITVAWTLGVYQLVGLHLNAITSLLPPVLMVLSLAVSVHLVQGWLEAPPTADRASRVLAVTRRLVFPCFFCTLTTALGFGSLATNAMPAVFQFGLFAALGVVIAFAVGMTLVPVGLTFLIPPATPADAPEHAWIRRSLDWAAEVSTQRPWHVVAIFLAITVLSLCGLPFLRNNTDLVRFLEPSAPLYRDTMFIDEHLTGTSALEFMLERVDGAPMATLDDVRRMAQFEQRQRAREGVTAVTSILPILRQIHRAELRGEALTLPENERDTAYVFDLLESGGDQPLVRKTISPDFKTARFSIRAHTMGTADAGPLVAAIVADGQQVFGNSYQLTPTGSYYRVVRDSNRLVLAQLQSFGSSMVLVFLVIGVLFRSLKLTGIAMIPNVMPIVWTGGLMGAVGIDLSTGTAMIASAVLGLVVDDTIHYLDHFRRVYRGDPVQAVRDTTRTVGAPLFLNNFTLVLGFWVGCFGSFKPTIYFSLLSGITMITALVCDLFLTPACLVLFDRNSRPTK